MCEDGLHLRRNTTACGVAPRVTFHLPPGRLLPRDLRPWFETRGVMFDPYTTVTCLPHGRGCVVYGSWADVDKVAVFLGRHADVFR